METLMDFHSETHWETLKDFLMVTLTDFHLEIH